MSVSSLGLAGVGPTLTPDRLRALLDACGYRSTMASVHGQHVLPAGCSVVVQFGDEMVRDSHGVRRITIRASIVINGEEKRLGGVVRWQIHKTLSVAVGDEHFCLAVEADLLLGTPVQLNAVGIMDGRVLRHLLLLMSDMRMTLSGMPISARGDDEAPLPVARIEARFAGETAAGRSGLVKPDRGEARSPATMIRTTARRVRIAVAICDCLTGRILSDLSRAARVMIAQAALSTSANSYAADAQSRRPCNPAETFPEPLQ
jgi:hypothetical protein